MRLTVLFIAFSFISRSQHLLPIQYDTLVHKYEAILSGVADYGSTSVENAFLNRFLFGGIISEEVKDRTWNKHNPINRLGADLQTEAEFRNYNSNLFGKEKFGWLMKGGYYNYAGLLYSQDLFGMTFYGNEGYLGESIDFSGTRGSGWSFQKIGFGIIDKKSKSNLSLNAYSVSNYGSLGISNGALFQSVEGDSLALLYDGYAEYKTPGDQTRGWGLGLDADIRIPVQLAKEQTAYIQFLVKNVGVAYIPEIKRYEADSLFIFEGLTFDQLFGDASVIDSNFSILDTLNVGSQTFSAFKFLPAFLQIGKVVDELSPKKVQSYFGARMYPSLVLVPQIYLGIHYKPVKWLAVGLNTSYGGYSTFRFGMYSSCVMKDFNIGIATENLIGLVSSRGMGKSLMLRLNWKI
jgi:hypothetical protein